MTEDTVFVVVYYGYEEGEFEVEAVFSRESDAEDHVRNETVHYTSPSRFAEQHYKIIERPINQGVKQSA